MERPNEKRRRERAEARQRDRKEGCYMPNPISKQGGYREQRVYGAEVRKWNK